MTHWVQKTICDTPLKEHGRHEVSITGFCLSACLSVCLSLSLALSLSVSLCFSLCVRVAVLRTRSFHGIFKCFFWNFFLKIFASYLYDNIYQREIFVTVFLPTKCSLNTYWIIKVCIYQLSFCNFRLIQKTGVFSLKTVFTKFYKKV